MTSSVPHSSYNRPLRMNSDGGRQGHAGIGHLPSNSAPAAPNAPLPRAPGPTLRATIAQPVYQSHNQRPIEPRQAHVPAFPTAVQGFGPSRGQRFRPVDPFSRRRGSQSSLPPGDHLHYPGRPAYVPAPLHQGVDYSIPQPVPNPGFIPSPATSDSSEANLFIPPGPPVSHPLPFMPPGPPVSHPLPFIPPPFTPSTASASVHIPSPVPSPPRSPRSPTTPEPRPGPSANPTTSSENSENKSAYEPKNPQNGPSPEPFIPAPYSPQTRLTIPQPLPTPVSPQHASPAGPYIPGYNNAPGELPYPATMIPRIPWWKQVHLFATDTLPRQLYLNVLLHLPALYYSRVTRIFTDAELCLPDIEKMFRLSDNDILDEQLFMNLKYPQDPQDFDTLYLLRFKTSWEEFIGSIITEWQVQNVVSVLLLSAVLTLLQIDDIGQDPLSRSTATFSLLFALMALLHGCVLMARFGSMKKLHKAAMWAEEAQSTTTHIFWNVWVFLSMPAVWLAWSVITFIITVLSYVWRTGANEHYEPLTYIHALGFRVSLSGVFAIGLLYFLLVLRTLAHYGSGLERRWNERVVAWKQLPPALPELPYHSHPQPPHSGIYPVPPFHQGAYHIPPNVDIPPIYSDALQHGFEVPSNPVPNLTRIIQVAPEVEEHVPGPYETLIIAGERTHVRFNWPIRSLLLDPPLAYGSPRAIYGFPLSDSSKEDTRIDHPYLLAENCIWTTEWDQFRSDAESAWEGKLNVPNVPPDTLHPLRQTIVQDILWIWNSWYFTARGLEAVLEEREGPQWHVVLYDKCIGLSRVLNEDQRTVFLVPRRLSVITELSEYEEGGIDNEVVMTSPSSSPRPLDSPRTALPHLPQLCGFAWGELNGSGYYAPESHFDAEASHITVPS